MRNVVIGVNWCANTARQCSRGLTHEVKSFEGSVRAGRLWRQCGRFGRRGVLYRVERFGTKVIARLLYWA